LALSPDLYRALGDLAPGFLWLVDAGGQFVYANRPWEEFTGSNLEQLKAEEGRLSEVVREQNISPEDVLRMNTEHDQLSRNLEDLKVKIAEAQKTILSLEQTRELSPEIRRPTQGYAAP